MTNFKIQLLSTILRKRNRGYHRYPVLPYLQRDKEQATNSNVSVSHQKGIEFEKHVVQLFDQEFFTLLEWRSDKAVNGIFPLMSQFPDLEFYFECEQENLQFAIECKWREHFYKESIRLKESQLVNYQLYEKVTSIPTFIVLGVGNTPSQPNQMYILPLKEIKDGQLYEMTLGPYRRTRVDSAFYMKAGNLY